jgi:hypothetical protein
MLQIRIQWINGIHWGQENSRNDSALNSMGICQLLRENKKVGPIGPTFVEFVDKGRLIALGRMLPPR